MKIDKYFHLYSRKDDVVFEEIEKPELKKGKWMVDPDGRLHCSRCLENPTNRVIIDGKLVYDMTPIAGKMKYCPNCGAKMEGGGR